MRILCLAPEILGGGVSGHAGNLQIDIRNAIFMQNSAHIWSTADHSADAGNITITAQNLNMTGSNGRGTDIQSKADGSGNGGVVTITVDGEINMLDYAFIISMMAGDGKPGYVKTRSTTLIIDGGASNFAYIGANPAPQSASTGRAGDVDVQAVSISLINGGGINSDTSNANTGGSVFVRSKNLTIDGGTITSTANVGVTGDAGAIEVNVMENLRILNGGRISTTSFGQGDGGSVLVTAANLLIDSGGDISSAALTFPWRPITGNTAGTVTVNVSGDAQILGNGSISSITFYSGTAGTDTVNARNLIIDGGGTIDSKSSNGSDAGTVNIIVYNDMHVLNGGRVLSDSTGQGNAGKVVVTVNGDMQVLNGGRVLSDSTGQGNAGTVVITVNGAMQVLNGGGVSSSTFSQGDAGSVTVTTENLVMDDAKIATAASANSTGKAGDVIVNVTQDATLLNSIISSQNDGTGDAGKVTMSVGHILKLVDSQIKTTAKTGDGGAIYIDPPIVILKNSQITTSVEGAGGNGGDITILGNFLILDTGFIQANAAGANGGDIYIGMDGVIGRGGNVEVGGQQRAVFQANSGQNVIQAAAPGGESGSVILSSPDTNSVASMLAVTGQLVAVQDTSRACSAAMRGQGRLYRKGRGGMPSGVLDSAIGGTVPTAAQGNKTTSRRQGKRATANQSSLCMN